MALSFSGLNKCVQLLIIQVSDACTGVKRKGEDEEADQQLTDEAIAKFGFSHRLLFDSFGNTQVSCKSLYKKPYEL